MAPRTKAQLTQFACWLLLAALTSSAMGAAAPTLTDYARAISTLIDPAKLGTLGQRGANPRVQKYVALLGEAQARGIRPKKVAGMAVARAGLKGAAAKLTAQAMIRNVRIAEKLGCLNEEGLREMRRGQAATIRRGPCKGQELSVDHIIPRALVPELDNVIANLELLPVRVNEAKNATVGVRQLDLARKLYKAGMLSVTGLHAVENRAK